MTVTPEHLRRFVIVQARALAALEPLARPTGAGLLMAEAGGSARLRAESLGDGFPAVGGVMLGSPTHVVKEAAGDGGPRELELLSQFGN